MKSNPGAGRGRALSAVIFVVAALLALSGCLKKPPVETPAPTAVPPSTATPDIRPTEPARTPDVTKAPDVTKSPATPEPTVNAPGLDTSINSSSPAFLKPTGDMGQEYIDKIIFLGDSTTYGLKHYEMLTDGFDTMQVWTPASGTLTLAYHSTAAIVYPPDGSEITIAEAVKRTKPEIMVITLGVNGVAFMSEDSFRTSYGSLIDAILSASPNTKIILQSIFPVASNYQYLSDINNPVILDANRWILSIAESKGVKYLNTLSVLLGEDGWLKMEYTNCDGIHLGPAGFTQVLGYIRTHGLK